MSQGNRKLLKAAMCCLYLCLFQGAFSQTLKEITFRDSITLGPVQNAYVHLICDDVSTKNRYTGVSGELKFYCESDTVYIYLVHPNYRFSGLVNLLKNEVDVLIPPLIQEIQEAQVTAYAAETPLLQSAASIGILENPGRLGLDNTSALNAMNSIPGVKMESRGYGGSRRISIRGSALRSPFAVRNIKMYWNDVPLSSPDGTSPLEMIDVEDVGRLEVVKGPGGSVYGAGIGGVLLYEGIRPEINVFNISNRFEMGQYGLMRNKIGVELSDSSSWMRVTHTFQNNDGYRDQESNEKYLMWITGGHQFSEKLYVEILALHYDGNWDLPGSLKLAEVAEDPTQARPYSIDGNASVRRVRDFMGISAEYQITPSIQNKTSIYTNRTDKQNPYGTTPFFNGFKDETAEGLGARTRFDAKWNITWPVVFTAGGEYQIEDGEFIEYTNSLGSRGDLKYENTSQFELYSAFAQANISSPFGTNLTVAASANFFDLDNTGFSSTLDTTLNAKVNFDSELLPRIALSQRIGDHFALFGSWSKGASYPTLFELIDVETGYINSRLIPETGDNSELGLKYSSNVRDLDASIQLYNLDLRNGIVSDIDSLERISYSNQSKAELQGLEFWLKKTIQNEPHQIISSIDFELSFAYQKYRSEQEDFDLPGTPYHTGTMRASVEFIRSVSVHIQNYWSDRMPLNNENSDFLDPYNNLTASVAYSRSYRAWNFSLFGGINNALDNQYTSFPILNAFGGRYYNPVADRNYFAGIGIAYRKPLAFN